MAAESVGDLLAVARAQQRSGMLNAEHARSGHLLEEGEVYILSGCPIYARVGRLFGDEALRRLLSWRKISFSFVVDGSRPGANLTSALPLQRMADSPFFPSSQMPSAFSLRPSTTGKLNWNGMNRSFNLPPIEEDEADFSQLVPQKVGPQRDALSLPLSRRQRVIYFLIDGRHSIGDLVRFSSKTLSEVELILRELQEQGLIAV